MSTDQTHEKLLKEVLGIVIENNKRIRPGTPMAELKSAIETALSSLPPLDFEEFKNAIDDTDAAERLVKRAPEIIGWNADQIVEWVEELAKKM